MVLQFLQKFPLGIRGLGLQMAYGLFLYGLVLLFKMNPWGFFAGFLFAHVYLFLFFYSVWLIFQKKSRVMGFLLMIFKWFLLILILLALSWLLEGTAFLLGLSAILSLLFLYALESFTK